MEEFSERSERIGAFRARLIYWLQVLSFFRPFAIKKMKVPNIENSIAMIRHYLKIAFRNFSRQKLAVTINIFSLTMGAGCAILIFLFIQNEWSFDQFHENKDQLYRINRGVFEGNGLLVDGLEGHPMPMAKAIKDAYPEILSTCRVFDVEDYVKHGNQLSEEQQYFVDSNFFEMFSFPFLAGDPTTALDDQNKVVITNRLARELFGKNNPMGETIEVFYENAFHPLQVSGVIEDLPPNSTLQFDVAVSFDFADNFGFTKKYKDSWSISFVRTFAMLQNGTDIEVLQQKTVEFCDQYFPRRTGIHQQYGEDSYYAEVFQPIQEIHFDALVESGLHEGGVRSHSFILGGIAWIILLIGCINFTILAIGRSASRVKEIGVRKVVGAGTNQLRYQFLGESLLMSFLGMVLGVLLAQALIEPFSELSNRQLSMMALLRPQSILFLLACTLLTGLLAGIYPALLLSGFKPVKMMSSRLKLGGGNVFTRSLVTLQFVLSTVLVLVTLVMADQLRFMKNRDLGFEKEALVVVQRQGQDRETFFKSFKNELSDNPNVEAITATSPAITHGAFRSNFEYEGKNIDYYITFIDTEYLNTMGIELLAGRNFRSGSSMDSTQHILINQAFAEALGWEEAIGKKVKGLDNAGLNEPIVIGLTDDFHFQSLEHAVAPMWFVLSDESSMNDLVVKVHPSNVSQVIKEMENIWKGLATEYPFTYSFLDEDMADLYAAEERWSRIISLSGIFAVVIAFLGMYGLIALSLAGRAKEMSLRKVLGASLDKLVITLTGPFARMVILAILIALPVAWYLSSRWLENYAYHVPFKPLNVLFAFLIIWILFVLAISYHIWRSARINPIEFLRAE